MARIENIQAYNAMKQAAVAPASGDAPVPVSGGAPVSGGVPVAGGATVSGGATSPLAGEMRPQGGIAAGAEIRDLKQEGMAYANAQEMHDAVVPQVRSAGIQGMSYDEAMEQGNISPAEYVREMEAKAKAEGRELNGYEAALSMLRKDDKETPEEKRKRERREKISATISGLGTLIGSAANLYYVTKGASPMNFGSIADKEDKRMEQIRAKREALKEKQDAILMNARMGDITYNRNAQAAKEKGERDAADKRSAREYDLNKFYAKQASDADKAEKDRKLKEAQLQEGARHNRTQEGIGWTNAETARKRAEKDKDEVAYSARFGDVIFDNPKNKRAVTLSLLEVMKDGASGKDRDELDELSAGVDGGDVDSYNKAELYVSQHLDSNPEALRRLYEFAGKYGRVRSSNRQTDVRRETLRQADERKKSQTKGKPDYSKYKRNAEKNAGGGSTAKKSPRPLN